MAHIAVIGGGIGGLAAAVALTRTGCTVAVYEQAAAYQEGGVGIHLASNGSRILRRWGLAKALDRVGVRPSAMEVRDPYDGHTLVRQLMGVAWEGEFGAPHYTVHREDLHRILADRLPSGCLRLGRELTGVRRRRDRVVLAFADGGTATADALVGADGVHSAVRRILVGPGAPVFSGTSAFRGLVEARDVPRLDPTTLYLWPGPDTRLLCYPVSGGPSFTYVALVPGDRWREESWAARGDPAVLARAFAGWDEEVTQLVRAVRETRRWALHDRDPLSRWGAGRVTLLGDAAHPMLPHLGQGASQAIEDAAVLARAVAGRPHSLERALRAYEAVRLPHTAAVQRASRWGGSQRLTPAQRQTTARRPSHPCLQDLVEDVSWIQRHDADQP